MRVEPLSPDLREAALGYLARSPYLNVFITHLLCHELGPEVRKSVFVAVDRDEVAGVVYSGRQIVLAVEPAAVAAFAESLPTNRGLRMLIGPRDEVRAFWQSVSRNYGRPRLLRDRQLVMMVDRPRLRAGAREVEVRHAASGEWRAVAESSAAMIAQELDYEPRREYAGFDAGIRQMIDRKLWWIGESGGRLCFFCNVGPWSKQTAQLQGIWTPPELRGRGLATASLAAICDRLLEVTPTLSLYVNDFNEAAVALYRRVGFEHVGDFQTILF